MVAAEPVLELRTALNLREDENVVLTKVCNGLIDAPRRWSKSLVRDTQQLGWRSCRHEPCLMTWTLSAEEHNIDGKTWRAELVSTTEFRRHIDKCHRTKSQGCESTRATGSLWSVRQVVLSCDFGSSVCFVC